MDFLKDLSLDKVRNLAEDAFNQAKPKTDLEAKVYEVLSHKNWGASSTIMNEIARDTYDHEKFIVITQLMWENMENQRPAAWRVVFKGLTLLEHLIKNGSERCVDDARNHGHSLRALQQFNYYEGTIDRGLGVREKSKQLVEILSDDERIREERQKAKALREKFGGSQSASSSAGKYSGYGNDNWSGGNDRNGYDDTRYNNSHDGKGYTGRYDEESSRAPSRSVDPTPTFAALPDESKKSKTKKKKKKDEIVTPDSEPAIDLFSFDTPAEGEFESFQSADVPGSDPFSAPSTSNNTVSFDAFGQSNQTQQYSAPSTDLFASSAQKEPQNFGFNSVQDPFASPSGFASNLDTLSGNQSQQVKTNTVVEDDFGDFAAAGTSVPVPAPVSKTTGPVDPLSKLISLDSLSKNTNKNNKEAKLSEPIIANAAAASFVQEKDQIHAYMKKSNNNGMSFEGIDGLPKHHAGFGTAMFPSPSLQMNGSYPNVMGGSGSNVSAISALDPAVMNSVQNKGSSGMPMTMSGSGQATGMNSFNQGGTGFNPGMTQTMGMNQMNSQFGINPGIPAMGTNTNGMGMNFANSGMGMNASNPGMGLNMMNQGMGTNTNNPGMGMGMNSFGTNTHNTGMPMHNNGMSFNAGNTNNMQNGMSGQGANTNAFSSFDNFR